jgi:hypothetical protein
MKYYTCHYVTKDTDKMALEIEADSVEGAYKKYLIQVPFIKNLEVKVVSSFVRETFYEHLTAESLDEQRAFKASDLLEILKTYRNKGYFKINIDEKEVLQIYFLNLIGELEERKINEEEIEFIRTWVNFKDRELGQSLIAKAEAARPSSERGKSQLAKTITMGIIAGNIAKGHQLRELKELNESVDEIAENVEDVSGGFEG